MDNVRAIPNVRDCRNDRLNLEVDATMFVEEPDMDNDSTSEQHPAQAVSADLDSDGALRLTRQDQLRAFDHPLRHLIIGRLGQEPATVKILADELDRAPGTIGHHTKVLEDAGLIGVVRTRQVNGITERWLGRMAATFAFPREVAAMNKTAWMLGQFADADELAHERGVDPRLLTVRIARIDAARAEAWHDRLLALAEEFAAEPVGGDTIHTVVLGITPACAVGDEENDRSEGANQPD